MPAIDRKCFDYKQTTSHGLVLRVYASQWNWACTAFEHVETKTEEVVFSRRRWLSFIVGVRSELVRSYDRPPASPSGAIFICCYRIPGTSESQAPAYQAAFRRRSDLALLHEQLLLLFELQPFFLQPSSKEGQRGRVKSWSKKTSKVYCKM